MMARIRRACLVVVAAAGLVGVPLAAEAPAREPPNTFARLVERMIPAVVSISAHRPMDEEEDESEFLPGRTYHKFNERPPHKRGKMPLVTSLGSGFLTSPDGTIVTNGHTVQDAVDITVTLHDGRNFDATVVGIDPPTDLAVIRIDAGVALPSLGWGESARAEIGDWVVAIGNPFGLGGSVTAGIISGRGRDIQTGPYDDYIQTDASINSGNSGGPLIDMGGRVIGVNTVILSPSGGNIGIGFAIPATMARPIAEQLRARGAVTRGWIGVQVKPVTPELARSLALGEPRGALVAEVFDGSPAKRAGLKVGDVILSIGPAEVRSVRTLPRIVAGMRPGEAAETVVWRNGRRQVLMPQVVAMANDTRPDSTTGGDPNLTGLPDSLFENGFPVPPAAER